MKWETSLTERALGATLIPVIMELYLGGHQGLRIVLDWLGVPSEAWIRGIYQAWTGTQFPLYLFEFGLIFSSLSLFAGFAKLFLPDQLIETLGLQEGLTSLTHADWLIIGAWIVLAIPVAMMVDYPLELVPVLQGVIFTGLQVAYLGMPSILNDFFGLPDSTTSIGTVTVVVVAAFILSLLVTHLFLLPIRLLDFYGLPL